jgi:protein SCO1/2
MAALALVAGAPATSLAGCVARRAPAAGPGAPAAALAGGALTPPVELPGLALQRAGGGRFTTADTRGRLSLFFFGYTTCPDVCPLTLAYVAQVRRRLGGGAGAQRLDAYFVTVDPERDTAARLVEYVAHFDPAIVPLTGTPEELERARAAFGVVAEKRPLPGSAAGYAMDHTALVYLVDGEGRIRLVYPHGVPPDVIAADVRRLLPAT